MLGLFRRRTEAGVKRTRDAWWGRVTTLFERATVSDDLWEELEELLVSADVGVGTSEKLISMLKEKASKEHLQEPTKLRQALEREIESLLATDGTADLFTGDRPQTILVVGVNGVGKTTSIAKLAHMLKGDGRRVVLAAADTFRAAAIDQLKIWGDRLHAPVVAHQPGGDPGAVVYDAIETARKNADVLIVDTAGRIHTKYNLMEELKKVRRVAGKAGVEPKVLLVLDATTGQNGLSQARHFTDAVRVDGILLAKLDSTSKGGIVLAISDELKIPIMYIGTGQELEDLAPFSPREFVEALFATPS